jgi:drug/metabolite transporter (DMT)-like permease
VFSCQPIFGLRLVFFGELAALCCAFLWASGVILLRRSGETVPPLALNLFKNSFAAILFVITLLVLRISLVPQGASRSDWILLLVSGVLGLGIGDTLLLAGLNRLGASRTAIAECFYGPFVAIGALFHPQLNEQWGPHIGVGLLLVALGIFLASQSEGKAEQKPISRRDKIVGFSLAITSVAIMAIGVVIAKPVIERHNVWWCTLVRLYGGLALLYPIGFLHRERRREVLAVLKPSKIWKTVIPAAFVATYLAMILLFTGLKYTTAVRASVINQTSTFFILILAWLFLKEPLNWLRVGSISLGFGGALVVILG